VLGNQQARENPPQQVVASLHSPPWQQAPLSVHRQLQYQEKYG
jgi:hypothetical protein